MAAMVERTVPIDAEAPDSDVVSNVSVVCTETGVASSVIASVILDVTGGPIVLSEVDAEETTIPVAASAVASVLYR